MSKTPLLETKQTDSIHIQKLEENSDEDRNSETEENYNSDVHSKPVS